MKKIMTVIFIPLLLLLVACSNDVGEAGNTAARGSDELDPLAYLHPPMAFNKIEHTLYEDDQGALKVIGYQYAEEEGLFSEDEVFYRPLIAVKYEGAFADEWNNRAGALFFERNDGKFFDLELNPTRRVYAQYKEKGDSIVIFESPDSFLEMSELTNIEYSNLEDEVVYHETVKASDKTISLLGIEKAAGYEIAENEWVKLIAENVLYDEEELEISVSGSILYKQDDQPNDLIIRLSIPSKNLNSLKHYWGAGAKSDHEEQSLAGTMDNFTYRFELEQPLSKGDHLIEFYYDSLGLKLNLDHGDVIHQESKSLITHPSLLSFSDYRGIKAANGESYHYTLRITGHKDNSNLENLYEDFDEIVEKAETKQHDSIHKFDVIPLGSLFKSIKMNVLLEESEYASFIENQQNINESNSLPINVRFYTVQNLNEIDDLEKHGTLLQEVEMKESLDELHSVELDVSDERFLVIYTTFPTHDQELQHEYYYIPNDYKYSLYNVLLANGEMVYK